MHLFMASYIISFSLNNTPLSECTTDYLSIHLLKDILVAPNFWYWWIKLLSTFVCRFLLGMFFLSMIAGLYGKPELSLSETAKLFLKQLYHVAFQLAIHKCCCASHSSSVFDVINVWNFSHSNWYLVVSHCQCNLQFPNDLWSWAYFHILLCYLYIFFDKVSIQIFYPFCN